MKKWSKSNNLKLKDKKKSSVLSLNWYVISYLMLGRTQFDIKWTQNFFCLSVSMCMLCEGELARLHQMKVKGQNITCGGYGFWPNGEKRRGIGTACGDTSPDLPTHFPFFVAVCNLLFCRRVLFGFSPPILLPTPLSDPLPGPSLDFYPPLRRRHVTPCSAKCLPPRFPLRGSTQDTYWHI